MIPQPVVAAQINMSKSGQLKVSRTKQIPRPNAYVQALLGEYSKWSFDEERAPQFKGVWREQAFGGLNQAIPLDLEIGTGNGLHFSHLAHTRPDHAVLGLELRYKPLIQSIRRCLNQGSVNARIARYNAYLLDELFVPEELNDVFIFFPDPWGKSRHHKHRLIQDQFLQRLHVMQRPGSKLYFKTDSRDYFDWSVERFSRSPYKMLGMTYDLHQSEFAAQNFITQFERIFMQQGIPIGFSILEV